MRACVREAIGQKIKNIHANSPLKRQWLKFYAVLEDLHREEEYVGGIVVAFIHILSPLYIL